jgi:hypothetical protein
MMGVMSLPSARRKESPAGCRARARQAAGERADRNAQHLGGFLVRQTLDQHQADHHALIVVQLRHRLVHVHAFVLAIGRPVAHRLADVLAHLLGQEDGVAPHARTHFVDPGVLHHGEHPAVESGPGLPLVQAQQRALDRQLHQVVGILAVTGDGARKTAQPRQQSRHGLASFVG